MDGQPQIALTDEGQQLYDALQNRLGEWLTRAEIADIIDSERTGLTQREIAFLDVMIVNGMIEKREVPKGGGIGFKTEYRAVSR